MQKKHLIYKKKKKRHYLLKVLFLHVCNFYVNSAEAVNYNFPGPPNSVPNGTTLTLIGATNDSFTVAAGNTFQVANTAVQMQGNTSINNFGTIRTTANFRTVLALPTDNRLSTITNNPGALIEAQIVAIEFADILGSFTVNNAGVIRGQTAGKFPAVSGVMTFNNLGSGSVVVPIIASPDLIQSRCSQLILTNDGNITPSSITDNAITCSRDDVPESLGIAHNITNTATGNINGAISYLSDAGTITNFGSITGDISLGHSLANPVLGSGVIVNLEANSSIANISAVNAAVGHTINFNGNFTLGGTITDIRNLNVNAETMTSGGNSITGFNSFTIAGGAQANLSSPITPGAGGTITNDGTLRASGGSDISAPILNNNLIELDGGTVSADITGTAGSSLNVISPSATAANIINVTTINVNAPFTIGNSITGFSQFNNNSSTLLSTAFEVPSGATFTNNGDVNSTIGTLTNNGTFIHNGSITGSITNNGVFSYDRIVTLSGDYTQNPSGNLYVTLYSPTSFGQLIVTNNAFLSGSLTLNLPDFGASILHGNSFDVLITENGTITYNNLVLTNPTHGNLTFTLVPNTKSVTLIGTRSFATLQVSRVPLRAQTPGLQGIADMLEFIRSHALTRNFIRVLAPIDRLAFLGQPIDPLLVQLIPNTNAALLNVSINNQQQTSTFLDNRIDVIRRMIQQEETGYSSGDPIELDGPICFGPLILGNYARQKAIGFMPGYHVKTSGFGLHGDISPFEPVILGLAGAVAYSRVVNTDVTRNRLNITNAQATLYGAYVFGLPFIDGQLSFGRNRYSSLRNIVYLNNQARAHYHGNQYLLKLRGGVACPIDCWEFTPLLSFQQAGVRISEYTETGSIVNLNVASQHVNNQQLGAGARLANITDPDYFLPEIHVFYLVDLKNPQVNVTSRFTDAGGFFVVQGAKQFKRKWNVGGSLTKMLCDDLYFTAVADCELKRRYQSYSGTLKLRWVF